jgi:hypothetical protein
MGLDLNTQGDASPLFDKCPGQTRPGWLKIGAAFLAMRGGLLLELQHDVLGLSLGAV